MLSEVRPLVRRFAWFELRTRARFVWVMLILGVVLSSCGGEKEANYRDGLGRDWYCSASYDSSTRFVYFNATLADGTPADHVEIRFFDEDGNQVGETQAVEGPTLFEEAPPEAESVMVGFEIGGTGGTLWSELP